MFDDEETAHRFYVQEAQTSLTSLVEKGFAEVSGFDELGQPRYTITPTGAAYIEKLYQENDDE